MSNEVVYVQPSKYIYVSAVTHRCLTLFCLSLQTSPINHTKCKYSCTVSEVYFYQITMSDRSILKTLLFKLVLLLHYYLDLEKFNN